MVERGCVQNEARGIKRPEVILLRKELNTSTHRCTGTWSALFESSNSCSLHQTELKFNLLNIVAFANRRLSFLFTEINSFASTYLLPGEVYNLQYANKAQYHLMDLLAIIWIERYAHCIR